MRIIPSNLLSSSDLIVDAVYEGGTEANAAADPLSKILQGVDNQGGFRAAGRGPDKKYVVLYTSGEEKDWPDTLDLSTGQFIYFGDNRRPGHQLHDTPRKGNELLRRVFEFLHATPPMRERIPPSFIFKSYPTPASSRSVQFKGLAVPGFTGIPATADLVAVWKTTEGQRFQNYRAIFTVLDAPVIARSWLQELADGNAAVARAPDAWQDWVNSGRMRPLASENTMIIRSVEEQRPDTPVKKAILRTVFEHFEQAPIAFEAFAARIFQMHDPRVIIDAVTRGSVDGGRDAVGRYLLGLPNDPVYAEFSLKAKCYQPGLDAAALNTVGVREVSRLISRIRHRQFGVLVTTSVIARQAYEEVREDRHPIVFFSGKDIAEILISNGYNTPTLVGSLLNTEFALTA